MQVVIRNYSGKGAKELFDTLEKHAAELKPLMGAVKGFVSYTLARSSSGGFSVTVCQEKAGIDESVQLAKDWISKNAPTVGATAPEVSTGSVILNVNVQ